MRRQVRLMIALFVPVVLAGCGGTPKGAAPVNAEQVLERTVKTLTEFDVYLRRYDYKKVDDAMYVQFNKTIQHDLNAEPRFHPTKIATVLNKDASITGYGDLNNNGKVDAEEPKLFKIELDTDNDRVIVTAAASGGATGKNMGRGSGFFAGVMIGSLMNRQTSNGVKPGHFDNRNVANAPATRKVAARAPNARNGARSGGIRGGK